MRTSSLATGTAVLVICFGSAVEGMAIPVPSWLSFVTRTHVSSFFAVQSRAVNSTIGNGTNLVLPGPASGINISAPLNTSAPTTTPDDSTPVNNSTLLSPPDPVDEEPVPDTVNDEPPPDTVNDEPPADTVNDEPPADTANDDPPPDTFDDETEPCSLVYQVRAGDICFDLWTRLGVDEATFRASNPELDEECLLQIGQMLCFSFS